MFPVGLKIERTGGVFEDEQRKPLEPQYSFVMELSGGVVVLLRPDSISELAAWPSVVGDMPSQSIDYDGQIEGRVISNAFYRCARSESERSANKDQLFLVLDGQWIAGVVPTQNGSTLHSEPLLTSPLFRAHDEFKSLNGNPITLDEMVGLE